MAALPDKIQNFFDSWDEAQQQTGTAWNNFFGGDTWDLMTPAQKQAVTEYYFANETINQTYQDMKDWMQNLIDSGQSVPTDYTYDGGTFTGSFYKLSTTGNKLYPCLYYAYKANQPRSMVAKSQHFEIEIVLQDYRAPNIGTVVTYPTTLDGTDILATPQTTANSFGVTYSNPEYSGQMRFHGIYHDTQGFFIDSTSEYGAYDLRMSCSVNTGVPTFTQGDRAPRYPAGGNVYTIEQNSADIPTGSPWDYYNNLLPDLIEDLPEGVPSDVIPFYQGGYIISPLPLSLWSIKETKDDKKVANVFPYDEDDAGNGTFYALVRPKIKYDFITRDSNNFIKIEGLSLEFEDAVRKSAWQNKYKIANFKWNEINKNDDVEEPIFENGDIIITSGTGNLIDLTEYSPNDSKLKQGFYKGQLVSYYKESRPSFIISVRVGWNNYIGDTWNGNVKINLQYKDENDEIQIISRNLISPITMSGEIIKFEVRSVDKNGQTIEYTISEEIETIPSGDENWWNININNSTIKYEGKTASCKIENKWIKPSYEIDQPSSDIVFQKYNKDFYRKTYALQSGFADMNEFISYLKTDNAMEEWKDQIRNSANVLKSGQIKAFYSNYIWNEDDISKKIQLIPFISIVERKMSGAIQWYDFRIKTITHANPNPFNNDMVERQDEHGNPIGNPILIDCPYTTLSKVIVPIYTFGTQPEKQYYRKGCAAKGTNTQEVLSPETWINDYDIEYLQPDPIADYHTLFYAAVPEEDTMPLINYNHICVNMAISNTNLKLNNSLQILMKNFCLYFIDEMCLDTPNVSDCIPYYYKISVLNPAESNQTGILNAELCFNSTKTQDFNIVSIKEISEISNPSDPTYLNHLLIDNNLNNFIIADNNQIAPDKIKIIDAYENVGGDLYNFSNDYTIFYQ